jgi:hypothetical protein
MFIRDSNPPRIARSNSLAFEQRAFDWLSHELAAGNLGLDPSCVSIKLHPKYFSRDRNRNIIFDIGLELRLPQHDQYSLLWLWECKDYSNSVPIDDLEEFYAKLQQVGGVNIKGGLITPSALQAGALQYAGSRGIAVVRLLPRNQVTWRKCSPGGMVESPEMDDRLALIDQDFHAINRNVFAFYGGQVYPDLSQIGGDSLQNHTLSSAGLLETKLHPPI